MACRCVERLAKRGPAVCLRARGAFRSLPALGVMYAPDAPFQLSHTGSGGMTSSLSVGTRGSAAVRKLRQYPLSPILTTGRSDIKIAPLEDPRFARQLVPESQLQMELHYMAANQWISRSRPVNDRATIQAMLKEYDPPKK